MRWPCGAVSQVGVPGSPGSEWPRRWADRRRPWGGARPPTSAPPRVYTDVQQVLGHLSHPRFTFTQSEADAHILYHFSHLKDYR